MATKICKGPCGKELDLEKFVSNPGCKDGREGTCKECRAKRGKEMRDAKLVASGKTAKKLKRIKAVKQPPDAPAEVKASQEIESKIQVDLTTIIDLIAKAVEQRVMKRISERLS